MVIVTIAMVALLGAAGLAIDVGVGWQARRNLVTATDAAALAAAQSYANGANGCADTVAKNYVTQNAAQATMTNCSATVNGSIGRVTVQAKETLDAYFGKLVGLNQFDATSTTTVRWGAPEYATGLRPLGLCAETPELTAFLNNPNAVQTHQISYTKDDPAQCGGNSTNGNWGTIDFDGTGGGLNDTKEWVENGYPGKVYSGTPGGTCVTEPNACYSGEPGVPTGAKNKLTDLMNSGQYFTLPVYDIADGSGNSNPNATYHFVAFVRVRLVDFKLTGAESQRYITLEFKPGLITGSCCNSGGPAGNAKVIQICAVDPNDFSGC